MVSRHPRTRGTGGRLGLARVRRRSLLLGALAALAGGCVRPNARVPAPPPSASISEVQAWDAEARAILEQALEPLRTFDTYAAYRIGHVPKSALRSPREIPWDPPSTPAWNQALAGLEPLHTRAAQLYEIVAASTPDESLWRERRALAAATRALSEMTDALLQYRDAIAKLDEDSDGGSALPHLGDAWHNWELSAGRWNVGRAEPIPC